VRQRLSGASLVAFVPTADLERSHAFYGGTLGLERIEASPFANAYDAGGTELRVTRVERPAGAGYTVLGWAVDDIVTAMGELGAAGIALLRFPGMDQDDGGVWTAPSGARVIWFQDPDANTLSVSQPRGGRQAASSR
jgi:catechol 2,3-dioxygenase-like lactoylglutathione lyase family enzyme